MSFFPCFIVPARAPVIAEVNLPETVNVLRALGGPSVYGINSKPVVDNLMVLCALSPAVGLLLSDLVSFHGTSNLQIVQQPQVACSLRQIEMRWSMCSFSVI